MESSLHVSSASSDLLSSNSDVIKVGTRKSQLACIQTQLAIDALKRVCNKQFEMVYKDTQGDKQLTSPLFKIPSKNLFTKELEDCLNNKEIDFIVHSLKDLPTTLPDNMVIAAIMKRACPYDAVVMHSTNADKNLASLPEGSVVGTSSLRRIAQLKRKYPHLKFESIRGNLNTRFRKLDNDDKYAAIILASAGLQRMNWGDRISHILKEDECLYAVSQGAIAMQCRIDDEKIKELLSPIHDTETVLQCVAERAFLKTLEGGCSVPIGTSSSIQDRNLSITGAIFSLDGQECVMETCQKLLPCDSEPPSKKVTLAGSIHYAHIIPGHISPSLLEAAMDLGVELANKLLDKDNGREILANAKQIVEQQRTVDND